MKILPSSFYLNGNTLGFYLRTQKARTTLFSVINSTIEKYFHFFRTSSLCLSPLLFKVPLAAGFYCVIFVCYQVESTPEEKGKQAYCGYYFFPTFPSSPGNRLLMTS